MAVIVAGVAVVRELAWMICCSLLDSLVKLLLLRVFCRGHIVRLWESELGVTRWVVECAPMSEVSFLMSSLVGSLPCSALKVFSHALTRALTCAMSIFGMECENVMCIPINTTTSNKNTGRIS